ncbi:hypothetical protein WJX74_005764 [Apatococcus lobatus]|uniref:Chromo domain-containing protein n=1 Tax=Apatococcus lobatus TaxID=904363 RepID=A0AAW1RJH0_9CHLO
MALEQVIAEPSHHDIGLSGLQFSEETLAGRDSGLPEVVSPARDVAGVITADEAGSQRMLGLPTGLTGLLSGYYSGTPSSSAPVEPATAPGRVDPSVTRGQDNSNIQMPQSNPEAGPVADEQQSVPSPAAAGITAEGGSGAAPQEPASTSKPSSAAKPTRKAAATRASPAIPSHRQNYDFLGKLPAETLLAQQPLPEDLQRLLVGRVLLRANDGNQAPTQGVVQNKSGSLEDPTYQCLFEGGHAEQLSEDQVQQMAQNLFCWVAGNVSPQYQIQHLLEGGNQVPKQANSKSPSKAASKSRDLPTPAAKTNIGGKRKQPIKVTQSDKPPEGSQQAGVLGGPAFKVPYHRSPDQADKASRATRLANRAKAATEAAAVPPSVPDSSPAQPRAKRRLSQTQNGGASVPDGGEMLTEHGDSAKAQAAASSEPCSRALGGAWQAHKAASAPVDPAAVGDSAEDAGIEQAHASAPAAVAVEPAAAYRADFAANALAQAAAAAGVNADLMPPEHDDDATTDEDGFHVAKASSNHLHSHATAGSPAEEAATTVVAEGLSSRVPHRSKQSRKASIPKRANVALAQLGGSRKKARKVASTATGEVVETAKTKESRGANPSKATSGLTALTTVAERAGEQDSAADKAGAAALEGMAEGPQEGGATSPMNKRAPGEHALAPRTRSRHAAGLDTANANGHGAAEASVGGRPESLHEGSQQAGPSSKVHNKAKGMANPQYVGMRHYADGRVYPESLCMSQGDIPYEDHVNAPFDPQQEIPVSHIVDERLTVDGNRELLPKWKGYELDPNAWEPASTFDNTVALQTWERKRKGKAPAAQKASQAPKQAHVPSPPRRTSKRSRANHPRKGREPKSTPHEVVDIHINGQMSEEDQEYVVEKIVDRRIDEHGKTEYLVKWRGYALEEDGWEPQKNLQDCKALDAYERKHGKSKQ